MEHSISIVPSPIIVNDIILSPPTFSRLPPDGHEFPPNFSEPIIISGIKQTQQITTTTANSTSTSILTKEDKIQRYLCALFHYIFLNI